MEREVDKNLGVALAKNNNYISRFGQVFASACSQYSKNKVE
jgi:hypothetical protein